ERKINNEHNSDYTCADPSARRGWLLWPQHVRSAWARRRSWSGADRCPRTLAARRPESPLIDKLAAISAATRLSSGLNVCIQQQTSRRGKAPRGRTEYGAVPVVSCGPALGHRGQPPPEVRPPGGHCPPGDNWQTN